jgi:branched-chain amino acid transport system substrate-binding protein
MGLYATITPPARSNSVAGRRKLAAIVVFDVVGYGRLANADEERILARLRALRSDLLDPTIAVHNGRVVKRLGDGGIVEFRSVVEAVRCAIEVQTGLIERNAGVPPERSIEFRVGIHLGDVVEEDDGDLMGDGVNVAARLQGVAAPGNICLSEDAYRQVKARLDLAASDLGQIRLKNIGEPVRVYSLNVGRSGFVPARDLMETRSRWARSIKSAATKAASNIRIAGAGISALTVIVGGVSYFLGAPSVRGLIDNEIRFGISAPFTGPANELGNQTRLGIEAAFKLVNEAGGINGRQLRLVAADDGYEPRRTAETMKQLYENQQVFGFIGNVGTPTAAVAVPYALQHRMLFLGAFTGAELLRRSPPDRYVFNYRASYVEETNAVVHYLVKVRHLRPEQIAVFAQHDAFGDAGFDGVARAVRALQGDEGAIVRLGYERNSVDVDNAVALLRGLKTPVEAVVMVATYRAAAKFIEKTHDLYPRMIYTNVSFVGSTALANELLLLGRRYMNGIIVTQVVPAIDSYASGILTYKSVLAKYFPGAPPDYVSLEGYVAANVLLEGLKRAGRNPNTEKLVEGLETLRDFDMGLGTPIGFSPRDHQGSHKVWGTQLNDQGSYQPIDLE